MKLRFAPTRNLSVCLCLIFSYALLLSSVGPFTTRSASASSAEESTLDNSKLLKNRESATVRNYSGAPSFTQQANQPRSRQGEVLVRFRSNASEQSKSTVATARGGQRKKLRGESRIEKLNVVGRSPEDLALELMQEPSVEFAEPNFLITKDEVIPSDPKFNEQWALRNAGQSGGQFGSDINAATAWQTTTGLSSTVIAVIDSGVDFEHPDLASNRWENPTPGPNGDLHGWDYVADTGVIKDEQGHGTAIAGIVAAQGNNGIGLSGVMWKASLMSLRVLDNTGTGDIGDAVEAIDYAVAHGAQVINISWGTTGKSMILKDALERAIQRGVVVVCRLS